LLIGHSAAELQWVHFPRIYERDWIFDDRNSRDCCSLEDSYEIVVVTRQQEMAGLATQEC